MTPFRKGYMPWNKGKAMGGATKAKIAETMRRVVAERPREATEAFIERSHARRGKPFSPEHIANLTAARRARTDKPWNKGRKLPPLSPEHRAKIGNGLCGHAISDRVRQSSAKVNLQHGHARRGRQTRTYLCWAAMLRRCYNQNCADYSLYGARGITVCEHWHTFENFLADMGEKPESLTLDRIDNDGIYEPGNCRWATSKEQAANRRKARKRCPS